MKQTRKMRERFKMIDWFVGDKKRLPNNFDIKEMFKIKGVGAGTKYILDEYKKSLIVCPTCGHKLK